MDLGYSVGLKGFLFDIIISVIAIYILNFIQILNQNPMKKISTLKVFVLSLIALPAISQTWSIQTSGTNSNLLALSFINSSEGWVGGAAGTILATNDGGATWAPQVSGLAGNIRGICFINSTTGWADGDLGKIIKTIDGGANWLPQVSGTANTLRGIQFVDANNGWAIGSAGTILNTIDGGTTWTAQTSGTVIPLLGVHFVNGSKGWASGSPTGIILATIDGGVTWTPQTTPNTNNLYSIHFADTNNGWATGWNGTVFNTNDGGTTWTTQTSGINSSLRGNDFPTSMNGWSVGDGGTIVTTLDGGVTWTPEVSGVNGILRAVDFVNAAAGWFVGDAGTILKYLAGPLQVNGTFTPVLCYGAATGSATANPIGGVPPYTYLWSNAANTQSITNILAGNYSCTITDAAAGSQMVNITVTQPLSALATSTASTGVIVSNDGTASVFPLGGVSPYTYLWSNASIMQAINGLAALTYTVTVTDGNGCISIDTAIVAPAGNGINNLSSAQEVSIYPNPSTGVFNISVNRTSEVTIFNCLGSIVSHTVVTGTKQIEIKTPGIYMLQVLTDGKVMNKKLINE